MASLDPEDGAPLLGRYGEQLRMGLGAAAGVCAGALLKVQLASQPRLLCNLPGFFFCFKLNIKHGFSGSGPRSTTLGSGCFFMAGTPRSAPSSTAT